MSDAEEIMALALRITQNALDDLITACRTGAPTPKQIMTARSMLVGWCDNSLTKDKS